SAWEYAHSIRPTGGSSFTFVGNIHGYEEQDSLTFTVDGASVTLSDGQTVLGNVLEITRETTLRHPDTGSTDLATVTTTYTLSGNGLRLRHTTEWAVGGTCTASYPAMFPVDRERFSKGMVNTLPTDLDVTAGDGTFKGRV